jgi:transposase-like protein
MTSVKAQHEALLDALLTAYTDPKDILGEHGLLKPLTKRGVERVLDAELTAHLGYAPYDRPGAADQNARNGKSHKTGQTDTGPWSLAVPRDRQGRFLPRLVPKRQRRLEGFDDQVVSLYARGLSTRAIQGHLEALYGTQVSPTLISSITDAVLEEGRTWQARPLASSDPILYFDALFVKARPEGAVQTKAVDLALGVTMDGEKDLLGWWLSESEGAKCWLSVFTELPNRGGQAGFIACVDGLKGLPEAIAVGFPKTQVQLCIVQKVRNSLTYVPWKARRAVAAAVRAI